MGRNGRARFFEKSLHRRIETCNSKYSTAEEIANHLRSTYSDYRRTKQQTLIRFVQEAIHSIRKLNHTPTPKYSDGDDDDNINPRSASRKRKKKFDEGEEMPRKMKALHVRRRVQNSSESDDEETVSTLEDAIYGEKVEPQFDLMKERPRMSYTPKKVAAAAAEKNFEMEMSDGRKGTVLNEGRKQSLRSGDLSKGKVKRKDWPRFKDLGGMKEVLEKLKMEVIIPLFQPQLLRALRGKPVAGILLHGPPGCGKTTLAHAIANESGLPFYPMAATNLVSGVSGASEENIRELFAKAYRTAPSIIFIDEIDAIGSKKENMQRDMEKRIVTQLTICMDQSTRLFQDDLDDVDNAGYVLVIGATNTPDALDPALRRPGRFDREIFICPPDEYARKEILSVITSHHRLDGLFDLQKIVRATSGFVSADLADLVNKATYVAMKRIINEKSISEHDEDWWTKPLSAEEIHKLAIVTMSDFEKASEEVQPSSRREGFSIIPNVKWEDVGGLDSLREEFEEDIVRPIKYPEDYEMLGDDLDTGFLLYGPPGCGKTLIAKAVASEAGASFIHIQGPELLNKYVGESERAVRTLFSRARTCAPCILFFDEIDALTTERGKEGGWVQPLNQLLVELDGAGNRRGVFVIGATNRPAVMDRALLRPGRFSKLLYVPLPGPYERALILKALARTKPIDATVDLSAIARMKACENLSGADLAALMCRATKAAIKEKDKTIKITHFEVALSKVRPSVSEEQKQYYQQLSESFKVA